MMSCTRMCQVKWFLNTIWKHYHRLRPNTCVSMCWTCSHTDCLRMWVLFCFRICNGFVHVLFHCDIENHCVMCEQTNTTIRALAINKNHACCILPFAYYCLLPPAYCLLFCLLPIAYGLLPIVYCLWIIIEVWTLPQTKMGGSLASHHRVWAAHSVWPNKRGMLDWVLGQAHENHTSIIYRLWNNSMCHTGGFYYIAYIAYCLLPIIAYCRLPVAYCLLPIIAYCLLPIAYYCLLPIAYCILPMYI